MPRRHELGVVILDGLKLGDMADRAERRATDLADPLGHIVGRAVDVRGLFVEQKVVIAEMRPAHVPVKILGLEVEREGVCQQAVERGGDGLHGSGVEIGRGIELRGLARLELGHFVHGAPRLGNCRLHAAVELRQRRRELSVPRPECALPRAIAQTSNSHKTYYGIFIRRLLAHRGGRGQIHDTDELNPTTL